MYVGTDLKNLNGEKFLSFRVFFACFLFPTSTFSGINPSTVLFLHMHSSRYSFIVVVSTTRLWRVNKERCSQEVLFGTVTGGPQTQIGNFGLEVVFRNWPL